MLQQSEGNAMIPDARWDMDLMDALSFEQRFAAAQIVLPNAEQARSIRPTFADSARAVDNIRAWRSYLSEGCVARMMEDGWQWST